MGGGFVIAGIVLSILAAVCVIGGLYGAATYWALAVLLVVAEGIADAIRGRR
jgi:hypothetical protein